MWRTCLYGNGTVCAFMVSTIAQQFPNNIIPTQTEYEMNTTTPCALESFINKLVEDEMFLDQGGGWKVVIDNARVQSARLRIRIRLNPA